MRVSATSKRPERFPLLVVWIWGRRPQTWDPVAPTSNGQTEEKYWGTKNPFLFFYSFNIKLENRPEPRLIHQNLFIQAPKIRFHVYRNSLLSQLMKNVSVNGRYQPVLFVLHKTAAVCLTLGDNVVTITTTGPLEACF